MKPHSFILTLATSVLIALSCNDNRIFQSLSVDSFADSLAVNGTVCLDVRTAEEYSEGHIPSAFLNIDVLQDSFEENVKGLIPEGSTVALYCRSGNRSKKAAEILSSNGFNVLELADGFNGWQKDGKPVAQELWIKNGDRDIYGVLSRPAESEGPQPMVIVAHGFNGTHHFSMNYFNMLNEMGYQCYAFDFPCGSVNSRSNNDTMNMSIVDECNDLKAIVRYFRNQKDVDPSRIVLLGESQGGFVSSLVASDIPSEVDKLILIFPALCIPDNWNQRYADVKDIPDTTRLWDVPMGRRFFMELRDIDAFANMEKYDNPVIIIQGDKDPVVSMEDSQRALNLYNDARLHVIVDAGHGFNPEQFEESLEQIRGFLNE